MERMVVKIMTGSCITVGADIFLLDFNLQNRPTSHSSLFNMSDQTNAAIVSIDTKDQNNLYLFFTYTFPMRLCLRYILHNNISPPLPILPTPCFVQLGKTLAIFVTNE